MAECGDPGAAELGFGDCAGCSVLLDHQPVTGFSGFQHRFLGRRLTISNLCLVFMN